MNLKNPFIVLALCALTANACAARIGDLDHSPCADVLEVDKIEEVKRAEQFRRDRRTQEPAWFDEYLEKASRMSTIELALDIPKDQTISSKDLSHLNSEVRSGYRMLTLLKQRDGKGYAGIRGRWPNTEEEFRYETAVTEARLCMVEVQVAHLKKRPMKRFVSSLALEPSVNAAPPKPAQPGLLSSDTTAYRPTTQSPISGSASRELGSSAPTAQTMRRQCARMRLDIIRKYPNLLDLNRARDELALFQGPCADEPDAQEKIRLNKELLAASGISSHSARTLTVRECFDKIVAIHQRGDRELQAAKGDASSEEAARKRSRQGQLDLFAGECAHHPEAASYVASAREQLQQSEQSGSSRRNESASTGSSPTNGLPPLSGTRTSPNRDYGERSRKLHDVRAEAHHCLAPVSGLYGFIENSCAEKVKFRHCVVNPKKGSWTDDDYFDCSRSLARGVQIGASTVGANSRATQHTGGGDRVLWFACKNGADPVDLRYDGTRITGKCVHP